MHGPLSFSKENPLFSEKADRPRRYLGESGPYLNGQTISRFANRPSGDHSPFPSGIPPNLTSLPVGERGHVGRYRLFEPDIFVAGAAPAG